MDHAVFPSAAAAPSFPCQSHSTPLLPTACTVSTPRRCVDLLLAIPKRMPCPCPLHRPHTTHLTHADTSLVLAAARVCPCWGLLGSWVGERGRGGVTAQALPVVTNGVVAPVGLVVVVLVVVMHLALWEMRRRRVTGIAGSGAVPNIFNMSEQRRQRLKHTTLVRHQTSRHINRCTASERSSNRGTSKLQQSGFRADEQNTPYGMCTHARKQPPRSCTNHPTTSINQPPTDCSTTQPTHLMVDDLPDASLDEQLGTLIAGEECDVHRLRP